MLAVYSLQYLISYIFVFYYRILFEIVLDDLRQFFQS